MIMLYQKFFRPMVKSFEAFGWNMLFPLFPWLAKVIRFDGLFWRVTKKR